MDSPTEVLLALAGLVLIVVILRQVFNDLFHPGGTGALSDWIGRGLFNLLRRRPRWLPLAGPVAMLAVFAAWVFALVVGFALIYYGEFPEDFRTSTGTVPPGGARFATVLYFSFETQITLGYGDLVPHTVATRYVSASQALVGFGLLTASVSSIVLLFPALSRMRLLARSISHLVTAEEGAGVSVPDLDSELVLHGLARDLTRARLDLIHFPIIYYFAPAEADASLARWLGHLARYAKHGSRQDRSARVQLAAHALDAALTEFTSLVNERFVRTPTHDRDTVVRAFAADQAVQLAP